MKDLVYLAVFAGCVLTTFGLAWLCARLAPAAADPKGGEK